MLLGELLEGLLGGEATLPDIEVSGVTTDSRLVREGDAFLALKGARYDGRDFIEDAAGRGASAVLSEAPLSSPYPIPAFEIADLRSHLAVLARRAYEARIEGLDIIGVTGTNGKTTVTFLLREAFRADGCGLIGTLKYDLVSEQTKALLTTPQVVEVWRFLAEIRQAGAKRAVMEVSSQGLDMGRVEGIPFHAAIFTNLTQDHLDYHGTMEAYLEAKLRLFRALGEDALAVVNLDDPAAGNVLGAIPARKAGVTLGEKAQFSQQLLKTWCGRIVENSLDGLRIEIRPADGDAFLLSSPLVGRFNAMNLLEAAACAIELGIPADDVAASFSEFKGAPGRLERVDGGQDFLVLVDYAHTPDALKNALETLRPLSKGRLICVFGCGGDRDPTKRPIMGSIASQIADLAYITSDNPRSEEPLRIIQQIRQGVDGTALIEIEPDRRKAIRLAVRAARAGEIILIAGKGHEDYQEIKGIRYPMDDRIEAREALREAGYD